MSISLRIRRDLSGLRLDLSVSFRGSLKNRLRDHQWMSSGIQHFDQQSTCHAWWLWYHVISNNGRVPTDDDDFVSTLHWPWPLTFKLGLLLKVGKCHKSQPSHSYLDLTRLSVIYDLTSQCEFRRWTLIGFWDYEAGKYWKFHCKFKVLIARWRLDNKVGFMRHVRCQFTAK